MPWGNKNVKLRLCPQEAYNLIFSLNNSGLSHCLNRNCRKDLYADKDLESVEKNRLHLSVNFDACLVL